MGKRTTKEKQDNPVEFSSELQQKIVEGKLAVDELYDALRTLSISSELAADGSAQSGIKAGDTLRGTQILIASLTERAKVASEALWEPFLQCDVQGSDEGGGGVKAKEESREQRIHENLQKLEKLVDPDGHFQREWERDRNLQMARDHYMALSQHAHERAEKAARKTRLKLVRKETQETRKQQGKEG